MEHQVLAMYHDNFGHLSSNKVIELISRLYWFPKMKLKVTAYISNCLKCIAYSPNSGKPEGELHNIPKGREPFQILHIDHYGPLEKSTSKQKYIFEIIDTFSKYVKFYPTKTTNTDEVIKHLKSYFRYYSKPKQLLISDRGVAFSSNKFKDFLQNEGVKHLLIATAAPRANGQMERINKVLTPMLGKLSPEINKWDKVLDQVEMAINNSVNRSTGKSPSQLLFGTNQYYAIDDKLKTYLEEINETPRDLLAIREDAISSMETAADYNKKYYDKRHKPPKKYDAGDYVVIKNVNVSVGVNKKLIPKFRGPYVVEKVFPNDRYLLKDIPGFQHTQIPFTGIYDSSRMRQWLSNDINSEINIDQLCDE
jgi:hypothetical protein